MIGLFAVVFDRDLVKTVDLTKPHQWYPMARALQRRIIYHAGPTNSGKTYAALQVPPSHDMYVACSMRTSLFWVLGS